MKKTMMAAAIGLMVSLSANAVTYHSPDHVMEKNLNRYGTGVESWDQSKFQAFTVADTHLIHHWAEVSPGDPMPIKTVGGLDVSKIMVEDVVPGKTIPLYNIMRDRASVISYVVMNKKGEIIAEDYWSNTNKDTKSNLMSSGKSFTSMAFAFAEKEGLIKASDPAGKHIPELKGTKWADIPLQSYLDMTAGIDKMVWSKGEIYEFPDGMPADTAMYRATGYYGLSEQDDGTLLPPPGAAGQLNSFGEYLRKWVTANEPAWEPGKAFQYRCLSTEIVARAFENASGMNMAEFVEKTLWAKGGFNSSASFMVNQKKESLGSGSLHLTNRDFAIGSLLMANKGKNWRGEQVLPERYVKEVYEGDDGVREAWTAVSYEHLLAPQAFYKNQWRTSTHPETGRTISTMIGVNGQFSAFDHETGNVIATFGAYRESTGLTMVQLYLYDIIFPLFDELAEKNKA